MKKLLSLLIFFFVCIPLFVSPIFAQNGDSGDSELCISDLVKKAKFMSSAIPSTDADVYIFFRAGLTSSYCIMEIERCTKVYRKMKKKAEIIVMLGTDEEGATKNWIKEFKIKLPVLAPESKGLFAFLTPYRHGGVPNVVVVTPSGRELVQEGGCPCCGDLIGNWKKLVKESKKYERARSKQIGNDDKKEEKEEASAGNGEGELAEKLPLKARLNKAVYVTKRKPAKNARLYFFLRASSSNAECRDFIPISLSLYKKLKGHGAEIIMLNADKDIKDAQLWAKESRIKFPIIAPESVPDIDILPSGQMPSMVVVTESGEELASGNSASSCEDILQKWDVYFQALPR